MGEDAWIGKTIGGFQIESRLGRGGMGVVYLAIQERPRRKVAVKVLAPELAADKGFRDRFHRESDIAASIEHPNIIPIYAAEEADGLLFIAMRYVDGIDLGSLLAREGPLAPDRLTAILAQVGSALDAAHEQGLIHRDVKPGNILVARAPKPGIEEHVYLADFGLGKKTTAETRLTVTGTVMGTLDYLAPEVWEGKDATAASDIYALGCVLFECLTGRVPFPRETQAAVLAAHLFEPPPRASEARAELPTEIDEVIATAMAKDPSERYSTCSALDRGTRAALQSTKVAGTRPTEPAAPPVRRAPTAKAEKQALPRARETRDRTSTPPVVTRRGITQLRILLTLVGAVGLIVAPFLDWTSGTRGVDFEFKVYYSTSAFGFDFRSLPPGAFPSAGLLLAGASPILAQEVGGGPGFLGSAGSAVLLVGILMAAGLALPSGWLTRVAGAVGILAFVLFALTLHRASAALGFDDIGAGMWITLLGGMAGVVGSFIGSGRLTPGEMTEPAAAPSLRRRTRSTRTTGGSRPRPEAGQ